MRTAKSNILIYVCKVIWVQIILRLRGSKLDFGGLPSLLIDENCWSCIVRWNGPNDFWKWNKFSNRFILSHGLHKAILMQYSSLFLKGGGTTVHASIQSVLLYKSSHWVLEFNGMEISGNASCWTSFCLFTFLPLVICAYCLIPLLFSEKNMTWCIHHTEAQCHLMLWVF